MATPTIEEIQRAIDGANAAGDQQAVDVLKARQDEIMAQMDTSAPPEQALPEGYVPGQKTAEIGALSDPIEGAGPALAKPSTDTQIDQSLAERQGSFSETAPAPKAPPKPMMDERERELAQVQYDADQELIAAGSTPTPEQLSEFMGMNAKGISPGDIKDGLGRQIVVDPKTGKARWSAMNPDQMETSLQRGNRGSTSKATVGALGYGSTRIGGAALSSAEADIERNNNFQRFLLTGAKGLSEAEQKRIMGLARKEYGKDVDPGEINSKKLKEWIDMNPENELVLRDIAGDEWWEGRKETWARMANRIGSRTPGGHLLNMFGADDPGGDMTGPGSYAMQERDPVTGEITSPGIDYRGKRAPAFSGASVALRDWKSDAKSGTGIYEGLILPLTTRITGKSPATHATEYSDSFIDEYYDEEQLAERKMSIFTDKVEVKNLLDLYPLVVESIKDPNTKLANPESAWLMFAENAPELGLSFAVTRGAGGWMARGAAKESYGLTVSAMDKARTTAAGRGGMLAGGATEGILVKEHLEQETRQVLEQVPMEVWEKNSTTFNQMVGAGLTKEAAKQIMSQEKASHAGNTAAVVTMLTGAPMNRFMGKSAAGRMVQDRPWLRRTVGGTGEPFTEGLQEVMEMMQTEAAVRPIDPDNPIYDDPHRYREAFAGGALISGPFGMMAALEPNQPAGVKKEDVDAARATAAYMEATNDRFKFETKITDPEHIANTTPMNRLKELNQLEQMQIAEAEAILKAEPAMRAFLMKQGPTKTAETEIKMLNRLVMRANAMKNDIAVAKSKRTTATKLQQAERQVLRDRAELQQKVNQEIVKLEDLESMSESIEAVQNLEAVDPAMEETLIKEGYARRTKTTDKLVVTPKGRRAVKELNRQARGLMGRLADGYTGTERRQGENLVKRDLVDSAGPVEREQMLYQDNLTGAQNRRAFNERQENIDVIARYGKPPWTEDEDGRGPPPPPGSTAVEKQPQKREGAQPIVAAVDVDSLAWVNDNMSHSAGDRLLVAVSDALSKQKGVEVYRLGGDEFAVTGASQEALETALQAAATELSETEVIAGEDVVTPQITWGKGETYEQADAQSLEMKQNRQQRGIIASRKKKAATYRHRAQKGLFQQAGIPDADFDAFLDHLFDSMEVSQAIVRDAPVSPEELSVELNKSLLDESYAAIDKSKIKNKGRARTVAAMRLAGDSSVKIASKVGTSVKAIEGIVRSAGLPNIRKVRATSKMNKVIQLLAEGKTRAEVASEMNTSNDVIKRYVSQARDAGIVIQEARARIPTTKRKMVKRLLQQGETQREIARQTGISRSTVQEISKAVKKGLFQMDSGEGGNLPRHWSRIKDTVERGDSIEVLTPDGAAQGIITNVTNRRGRPRIRANIQGRSFLFNPQSNHLIVDKYLDPADLAWLTGDAEYAQPGRETFPQTLVDINIGHLGKDGQWYADLADDFEYEPISPWWVTENPSLNYGTTTPFMPPMEQSATVDELLKTEYVRAQLTKDMDNLPDIHIVESMDELRRTHPEVVEQIRDELIAMGGSGSFAGVRGYMDHINPENGIFVFPAHIPGSIKGGGFESNVVETIWHEMIGHYGVRGMFGYEADLRTEMHSLVDAFPRVADHYAIKLGLDKSRPDHKQLLGEEMVAYLAGQVKAKQVKFTTKQKSAWARFVAWVKSFMVRHHMDRFAPVKKMVTLHDSKELFWNDSRVQDMLSRSRDFVRHGNGFEWTPLEDTTKPWMRDRDIFQAGFITAMTTATYKPNNREKGELAKQYGGKENVPDEVPLFPDATTPNGWKQLIIKAQKEKHMTARETELSGLSDKSDFNLFTDGSYGTLEHYMNQLHGNFVPTGWYRGILPAHIASELDEINKAMEQNFIAGPLKPIGTSGYGEERTYSYDPRPTKNAVSADLMRERIAEIMSQKMDPKKTRITKELMMAHMLSENAYRVFVEQQGRHPSLTREMAARRLFGDLDPHEINSLDEMQQQMIKAEVKKSRERGYNIGYDRAMDRWFDWAGHTTEYSEWSPQGSRVNQDFRVMLIKSEGRDGEMGYTGHYDKNIMHIRTGVAELLNWDGMPELEFPNPAMQGKMLSLIELQSDWLQALRKGFATHDEKSAADQGYTEKRKLLHMVGDNLGKGIAADLWKAINEQLKPVINVTDGSGEVPSDGSLFPELKNKVRLDLGQQWEDITLDQKREVWKSFIVEQLNNVRDLVSDARDGVTEVRDALPKKDLIVGTQDIRGFEILDAMAARRAANSIISDLDRTITELYDTLRYSDTQAKLVTAVSEMQRRFGRNLTSLSSSTDYGEGLRFPMIEYQLTPMLEVLYGRLGADKNRIAELMSGLKSREMATVRIPRTVLEDANTAMTTGFDAKSLMNEIVAGSRISRHGDVEPGALIMRAERAGDGFIDVKVIGSKADVEKSKDLIPKLINTWFDNHAAEKRRIAQGQRNRPDNSDGTEAAGDYSYNELVDLYSLEEEDTSGEMTSEMREQGVTSYYEFEENERGEIESEIVDERWSNMTEDEWDDLEDDQEGVSREGTAYRDALVIDADGDVDNDAAESLLNDARNEYRMELYNDDTIMDEVYSQVNEQWNERGPTALIQGSLPVRWDSDNDPIEYVNIMIRAQDPGDSYDIYLDDDEVNYESDIEDAKRGLSDEIVNYYNSEEIVPPAGVPFGPAEAPAPVITEAPTEDKGPNWDLVKGNILENISMMSDESQKMDKVYEQFVTLGKRLGSGGVYSDSPVAKDEQWRPLALKFLISDAVRRGLGGVMWNNGMSSSTRGGMGVRGVTETSRVTWSKETVGIRGQEQDVYVIRWAEGSKPIVVSMNSMVPVLGADVARTIMMQEKGKIEVPTMERQNEDGSMGPPNLRDNYIIGRTADGLQAVYRRSNNEFLGFAATDDAVIRTIDQDLQHADRPDTTGDQQIAEGEPLGHVLSRGMVDERLAGGKIRIITGGRISGFSPTFDVPRLAGARKSYEDITVRMWNKELKKYGAQISDTYVKANNMQKAEEEGQPSMQTPKRDEQVAEQHGRLYVAEMTGDMHGWVIMSEKNGAVIQDVFTDKARAEQRLNQYLTENYGSNREGVKVMYFPINEKMREEFSGPVAPFHYNPKKDPGLKSAAAKVGYLKRPLKKRIREFRQGIGAEAKQGMLDQFYGLRRALTEAGVDMEAYMSARLTTSLDSMMKAVLHYGHPVWEDGIVQNKGKGLLEVFQPILNDPDSWGLYMAGKRAKGLMLEGFDELTVEEKQLITTAADHFDGDIMKMMSFAMNYDTSFERDPGTTKERKLGKGARDEVNDLEGTIDDLEEVRDKGKYRDREGRLIAKEQAEEQIAQLREKLVGVKQRRSPPSRHWIDKVNKHLTFFENQLDPQAAIDRMKERVASIRDAHKARPKKRKRWAKRDNSLAALPAINKLIEHGREHLFEPTEIVSMVRLGEKFPHFERVAKDYAAFNKKMLDFAESSGIIDASSRPTWENADYVPFYRAGDDRLVGSSMSPKSGIANQRAPIRRLTGKDERVGDIMGNIMMNITKLVDASVKNNAALESIDALRGSGIISKKPLDWKPQMIPMGQMKQVLLNRGIIVPDNKAGIHLSDVPKEALEGMQKMFALTAPEGDGIVSVMRDGKREYYYTDDMLLYRSLSSINKKQFGEWINLFRAPKRLLTTLITTDPAFMLSNFTRDTGSAFVIGRDHGNLPVLSAIKGFKQALLEDEAMRTLVGAGAAFENGYITGGDPRQTKKLLKAAMKKRSFSQSVLDTPQKLIRAWLHLGSSIENSNRMAVYNAAIAAGKSKKQAAYEAKDLMDFSMGGDWPVIQFLIQTVPFMNARAQGNYRLARGAYDHPVAFTIKGLIISMAGLALYGAFKDDERYKGLATYDRQAYYHWWIGDKHYRLPKPFEVGAIFNTIPEMMFDYAYSQETDAGKDLMKEYWHMLTQTFSMSPWPQTAAPIREMSNNWNYFRDRPIVSYYEQKRLPPDQYRSSTSPTMIELAKALPAGLDTVNGKIRSPLHLQNLYAGYTGTIGRYVLQASDMIVQRSLDYPMPPKYEVQDVPVLGRFVRGDNPPRRTKYETQVYDLLQKTTAIQGSLAFHERQGNVEEYLKTHSEHEPYIRAAGPLEDIRENIQNVNRAILAIRMNPNLDGKGDPLPESHKDFYTPERKQQEIDELERTRNVLFKEGWKLRPGGEYNPTDEPVETSQVIDMIDNFGVDNSAAFMRHIEKNSPDTYELLEMVNNDMSKNNLASLAKLTE